MITKETKIVYRVHKVRTMFDSTIDNYENYIEHKWDAYEQRRNYNAQKRHERYIRDRDAGKTGYIGKQYKPIYGGNVKKIKNTGYAASTPSASPSQPQQSEEKSKKSSGSGKSAEDRAAEREAKAREREARAQERERIKQLVAQIREASAADKQELRDSANSAIESKREEIKSKSDEIRDKIAQLKDAENAKRTQAKEEAKIDIEKAKDKKEKDIETDTEKAKKELESKTNPIRTKLAALRGRLESTSNPELVAKLKTQIAANADQICQANMDYTESVSKLKTEHTKTMRESITKIRNDLKTLLTASIQNQKEKTTEMRNELSKMRKDNNDAIKTIRTQLKADLKENTSRTKKLIERAKSGEQLDLTKDYNMISRSREDWEKIGEKAVKSSANKKASSIGKMTESSNSVSSRIIGRKNTGMTESSSISSVKKKKKSK